MGTTKGVILSENVYKLDIKTDKNYILIII